MTPKTYSRDYSRQFVKGIFFCKDTADRAICRKLLQDLGCTIIQEQSNTMTIQASRSRLKELKARYMSVDDDVSQISSRLQEHFDRIMIGGDGR